MPMAALCQTKFRANFCFRLTSVRCQDCDKDMSTSGSGDSAAGVHNVPSNDPPRGGQGNDASNDPPVDEGEGPSQVLARMNRQWSRFREADWEEVLSSASSEISYSMLSTVDTEDEGDVPTQTVMSV